MRGSTFLTQNGGLLTQAAVLFTVHDGTPRRIRTPSLLVRSQTLYPVELWAHLIRPFLAEREGFEPSVSFPTHA